MRWTAKAALFLAAMPLMVPYDDGRAWLPSTWFVPPVLPNRLGEVRFRPLVEAER